MFVINGERWWVELVPPAATILLLPNGQFTVGACDDATKTIYISDQIYGSFFKKVLCHEITHAAMFAYDVTLSPEQEELIAELIATFGEEIIDITNCLFYQLKSVI